MLVGLVRMVALMEQLVVWDWVHTELAVAVLETTGLPVHNAILLGLARLLVVSGLFLLLRSLLPVRRLALSACRNFHRILSHRRGADYILDIS